MSVEQLPQMLFAYRGFSKQPAVTDFLDIAGLKVDLNGDALPVMLSLIDQLYDTRLRLLSLAAAVATQDKTIQAAIVAAIEPGRG